MSELIAIKKLTASDCTLFEAVFRKINSGNQKSINLNSDVLVDQLYPNLSAMAALVDNEIALPISIYGPAGKGAHKLARKIIKTASYKNWRLNGEFIHGPPDDGSRYDDVRPGDLAVMMFKGQQAPNRMDMILVSQADAIDAALHAALDPWFSERSMIAVTSKQVAGAAISARVPETHPIFIAAADPEREAMLEDAAQSGFEGAHRLLTNQGARAMSASDLANAKARAELAGRDGEGLVNAYLAGRLAAAEIAGYIWRSAENAIAPFDFEIIANDGQRTRIDAKSTRGRFENPIHISLFEVIEASGETPYQIYRVFELDDDGGKLCISDDIRPLARKLKAVHEENMPDGVRVDSFSVVASVLNWSPVKNVRKPDQDGAD